MISVLGVEHQAVFSLQSVYEVTYFPLGLMSNATPLENILQVYAGGSSSNVWGCADLRR